VKASSMKFAWILIVAFLLVASVSAQVTSDEATAMPADLHMEIHFPSGSNQFQVGQTIPLDVILSSDTPQKYLEPCQLFAKPSCFGFPICRFAGQWSFEIAPKAGWRDLEKDFQCLTSGGPTFLVPSRDLGPEPTRFNFVFTRRFRFEKPGKYTVKFTLPIGLDDESTSIERKQATLPHSVTISREFELELVASSAEWESNVISRGLSAYRAPSESPEFLTLREERRAFCDLETTESTRAQARLLAEGNSEVTSCLFRSKYHAVAVDELRKLSVDSDVGVSLTMFQTLIGLLDDPESTQQKIMMRPEFVDMERASLISALPKKSAKARVISLGTVLMNPPHIAAGSPHEFGYVGTFDPRVIAMAAADFRSLDDSQQSWLLDSGWDGIRSPQMIPVLRELASGGNGQALLRWSELDPVAAGEFMHVQLLRPLPLFSSNYLQWNGRVSLAEEEQIAQNFVTLVPDTRNQEAYAARLASLLEHFASKAVLPILAPVIDAKMSSWPCSVRVPVLAYLLRVSPEKAKVGIEQSLKDFRPGVCVTMLSDLGQLQKSPILERIAFAQLEGETHWARNAAEYLRLYGSVPAKPKVLRQVEIWHEKYAKDESSNPTGPATGYEQSERRYAYSEIVGAYTRAQAWMLTPEEESRLGRTIGEQMLASERCRFGCGGTLAPKSTEFAIYGHKNEYVDRRSESWMDYLNPRERLHYAVNQYRCNTMASLREKLLQLPSGSSFTFAWDFTARDKGEILEITRFLRAHGYTVRNVQNWPFLQESQP
jgi:hypothetical protein